MLAVGSWWTSCGCAVRGRACLRCSHTPGRRSSRGRHTSAPSPGRPRAPVR